MIAVAAWLPHAAAAQSGPAGADKPLASYRDKNRVLIVFAPAPGDPAYLEQMKLWQGEKTGFEDRQLVVMSSFAKMKLAPSEQQTQLNALTKKYRTDADSFAVVLIGKDGRDAFHSSKPVPPAALYEIIDAMPMRRTEAKRSPSPSPTPVPTPRRPDLDHDE